MIKLTKSEQAHLNNIMAAKWAATPLEALNTFIWCYSDRLKRQPQVYDECCELAKKLAGH